jgi:hypothetical protein
VGHSTTRAHSHSGHLTEAVLPRTQAVTNGAERLKVGTFRRHMTVRSGIEDEGCRGEAGHGSPSGREGNRLGRHLRQVSWGRVRGPVD